MSLKREALNPDWAITLFSHHICEWSYTMCHSMCVESSATEKLHYSAGNTLLRLMEWTSATLKGMSTKEDLVYNSAFYVQ